MTPKFDYELFGLEARDLRVYEALLGSYEASSIRLIGELVGLNYGTTYEVIKKLLRVGLVSAQIKDKRRYYAAEDPQKLQIFASERQMTISHELQMVATYVSSLQHRKKISPVEQFTKFYDGEEEVAALLRDVLATVALLEHKQYQIFSSAEVRNYLYAKFLNFTRRRVQMGIAVQVIGVGKVGRKAKYAERRQMSVAPDAVPAAYIIIYGDKVAQISLPETGYIQGVMVHDAAVAALQRIAFKSLWDRSCRIDDSLLKAGRLL